MHARIAGDLRTGAHTTPDFGEGLRLHRLLDAVADPTHDGDLVSHTVLPAAPFLTWEERR
ncbi:MAG: hypothetical protein QOE54_4239 [Streptosporangiaceae bacterium]|jgi:hypothetical protein|nr:hypothetical protein [Streptosporangiaceae bacterium]MDX6431873.1 hypothetical protein [Streptosporangiaceae bacterium]